MFLLNFFRCLFCIRIKCPKRFTVGTRRYYRSYWPSDIVYCPKDYPLGDSYKTINEIREQIDREVEEEKSN